MVSTFPMMAESLAWNATKKSTTNHNNGGSILEKLRITRSTCCSNNKNSSTEQKSRGKTKSQSPSVYELTPTNRVIQDYVQRVVSESPLLQQTPASTQTESLSRRAFSVGSLVGEGSFSQVFGVRKRGRSSPNNNNNNSSQKQVLKQLHPRLFQVRVQAQDASSAGMILQDAQFQLDQAAADLMLEALYLSSLNHPHIVSVRALSNTSTDFFVCLEHCPTTLAATLGEWRTHTHKHKPQQLRQQQLQYATQLADALQYLHSHRIVLRDLKPDNVGLSHNHTVKLLDFGLCRELPRAEEGSSRDFSVSTHSSADTATSTNNNDTTTNEPVFHMTQVGTLRYCAPEVLTHQAYNQKCDIYSFAVLLYELVTLQVAYPTLTTTSEASQLHHMETVGLQGKRPGLRLYRVDPKVERIIRKSWQRNIAKRWNAAQVFRAMQEVVTSSSDSNEKDEHSIRKQ